MERLMQAMGLQGEVRGRQINTTNPTLWHRIDRGSRETQFPGHDRTRGGPRLPVGPDRTPLLDLLSREAMSATRHLLASLYAGVAEA